MTIKTLSQRTPPPNVLEAVRIAAASLERRRAREAAKSRKAGASQPKERMTEAGDDKRP
ncbi:MAG: hypothetical protein IJJ33_19930 [Victivallales bacterium]|nr:hypothetical protein [Victivallales bacterium]